MFLKTFSNVVAGLLVFLCCLNSFAATTRYEYDELNRLSKVWYDSVNHVEYQYDQIGNMLSKTPIGNTHTITATGNSVCKIFPLDSTTLFHGNNITYTIKPNSSQFNPVVFVDGVSQGPISSYTFYNVTSDHTISLGSDVTPPTTTASPVGGTYTQVQSVALTANESSTIYFTLDGSIPTSASQVYHTPLLISRSAVLQYFAVDANGNAESVKRQIYSIYLDTTPPNTSSSPGGGSYATPQTVTLSVDEPATIYYTTDGTAPTIMSPVYSGPISISTSTILKYFGRDSSGNSEPVITEIYTIGSTTSDTGTIVLTSPGYYTHTFTASSYVTLSYLKGAGGGGSDWYDDNWGNTGTGDPSQVVYDGVTMATANGGGGGSNNKGASGTATNTIGGINTTGGGNAGGAGIMGGGDGGNGGAVTGASSFQAVAGKTLTLTIGGGGYASGIAQPGTSGSVFISWGPGDTVPPTTTASPVGGLYSHAVSVSLAADEQAVIYYTTNGTTPTTSSAIYSGPIQLNATATLKYFAKDQAGNSENVKSQSYVIDTTPPVTTVTPRGGSYASAKVVTMTTNEPATIYYTTNGSSPTTSSNVYSGPITISVSTTLKYFAKDTAGNSEIIATESYIIDSTAPVTSASPAGGGYSTPQTVTLSSNESSTIYYTTDGTTPSVASSVYTAPLLISATTTLKYFAKDAAGNANAVNTQVYTIGVATDTGSIIQSIPGTYSHTFTTNATVYVTYLKGAGGGGCDWYDDNWGDTGTGDPSLIVYNGGTKATANGGGGAGQGSGSSGTASNSIGGTNIVGGGNAGGTGIVGGGNGGTGGSVTTASFPVAAGKVLTVTLGNGGYPSGSAGGGSPGSVYLTWGP